MQRVDRHSFTAGANLIARRLRRQRVKLTIGGEPSYVPVDPAGAEWSFTAVGPTKLRYAHALANALIKHVVPGALAFFSLGKRYPGEINPRWVIHLLWNRDGSPGTLPAASHNLTAIHPRKLAAVRREMLARLKLRGGWHQATDPNAPGVPVWILPLDHRGRKWFTARWLKRSSGPLKLLEGESPAGLRLPLDALPADTVKRALVLETKDDGLHIFLPPVRQKPFLQLLKIVGSALRSASVSHRFLEGYVPRDDAAIWSSLSLTADPGVLEVNLPACDNLCEYAAWMKQLERCCAIAGLRSFKQLSMEETLGTGGGNHLLFGGPTMEENAFFKNPHWVTSILRYWQRHPSLSYLFTGSYVGSSSQAPRPDESAGDLYDLEMAYRFLEKLEPGGDHRQLIGDTLRHLHIDRAGNTHRSEISFDKFWNTGWDGGCRGLIEFRAVESLPHAAWMSHVALLWTGLALFLLEKNWSLPLVDHGARLHDAYFLPAVQWEDFQTVLRDLRRARLLLDGKVFREIWEYRFPRMLEFSRGKAELMVRRALESWPLLSETPLEGGSTSRFVDTSIERLEFVANDAFASTHRVFIQGRELILTNYSGGKGAGLRYRRSALHPSLHPGMPPHIPLKLTITDRARRGAVIYELRENRRRFVLVPSVRAALRNRPCQKLKPDLVTYDLRLP